MRNTKETQAGREDQGITPSAPPRRRRLKSAQDLRQFLADLLNRVNRNEVSQAHARCMGYLAQVLSGIIQTSDLEQRIKALEEKEQER